MTENFLSKLSLLKDKLLRKKEEEIIDMVKSVEEKSKTEPHKLCKEDLVDSADNLCLCEIDGAKICENQEKIEEFKVTDEDILTDNDFDFDEVKHIK